MSHFTRTAEQLNMTQSGVSQHVRKLEDQLAQPLLIRHGKRFTLTDAGERLYREGRELIRSLSDLEKRVGADPAFEGLVRVVSPGSVGLKLYRHLLNFQAQHPELIIDYRFAPNSEVERLIVEHKVDIGFMTSPSTRSEVSFRPVAEEELLLVTPESMREPLWENLSSLGFIDHPDGIYHAGLLLGANYPQFVHGKQFKQAGFSNQINLILEPVSMGLGFTVLPHHAVAAFSDPARLKVHALDQSVRETLYLSLHTNKFTPRRVKTVIAEAERCLE